MNNHETHLITNEKVCGECGELYPLTNYYTRGKNRYEANCKPCALEIKKKIYKTAKTIQKRKLTLGKKPIRLIPLIKHNLITRNST